MSCIISREILIDGNTVLIYLGIQPVALESINSGGNARNCHYWSFGTRLGNSPAIHIVLVGVIKNRVDEQLFTIPNKGEHAIGITLTDWKCDDSLFVLIISIGDFPWVVIPGNIQESVVTIDIGVRVNNSA